MKILEFLRQMVPSFKREDVTEKLRQLREALEDQTIPPHEQLVAEPVKARSKPMQDYDKAFAKAVDTPFRGNWAEVTLAVLRNILANVGFFEALVDKNYSRDIIAAGITFKKGEILRLIAIADFTATYARQQMLYLLAAEGNVDAKTLQVGKERPLPELKWLEANRAGFFRCLNLMALKSADLSKALDDIPDMIVNEDTAVNAEQTVGAVKLDPFATGLIPITWNPFYYIGVRMANREKARMDRAKNEKRAMEFRIEQLRLQARGESDAKLEKTIEFYEDEVNILAAKIAKFED